MLIYNRVLKVSNVWIKKPLSIRIGRYCYLAHSQNILNINIRCHNWRTLPTACALCSGCPAVSWCPRKAGGPLLAAECCYAECWPATALGSSLRPGGQAPAQAATPCTTDILTAAAHYRPPTPRFFNEMTSVLEMEGSNKYLKSRSLVDVNIAGCLQLAFC